MNVLNKDVEANLKTWRKGKPIVTPSKTQRLVEKMQDANEPKAKKVKSILEEVQENGAE